MEQLGDGHDQIPFHTSVRTIETTRKFQDEINRRQKVGKCTSMRPKGHLGETELLGFRQWLCQVYLDGSGWMCFSGTEIGFMVLDVDECEGVAEDFGAISLRT